MSAVNLTNVTVLDYPASFLAPFQFEISYDCLTPPQDDLEWKLIYVGSAEDETSWANQCGELSFQFTGNLQWLLVPSVSFGFVYGIKLDLYCCWTCRQTRQTHQKFVKKIV